MSTKKVSLALGLDELAWAKRRAGRKRSLSSVVTEALRVARRLEAQKEVVAWLFEGKPTPPEAQPSRVRSEWDSPSTRGR